MKLTRYGIQLNYNIGQPQVVTTNKQEVQLATANHHGQLKIHAPNNSQDIITPGSHRVASSQLKVPTPKNCQDITTPGSHSVEISQLKIPATKKYPCKLCSFRAARKGDLKRHQNAFHKYYCSINTPTSPPITTNKQEVQLSTANNQGQLKIPAPNNSQDIRTLGSYRVARGQLKIPATKKYACILCNYRAARKGDLERHRNTIHKYSSIITSTSPAKQKIAKNLVGNGNKPRVSLLLHPLPQNNSSASI